MKKIMLSMFCIFLLVGCSTKQENITIKKNNNQETVDLKVGFGLHHIEDGYSFDGNDVDINYDLIDYTSDLLKHDEEGYFDNNLLIQFPNNLEGNFKKNKPITIKMSGISDNYILWVLEDLKPVSSYHIELPKNKSAVLSYKPGNKTKNVKAIAIPLSSNLPEESTSLVVK